MENGSPGEIYGTLKCKQSTEDKRKNKKEIQLQEEDGSIKEP